MTEPCRQVVGAAVGSLLRDGEWHECGRPMFAYLVAGDHLTPVCRRHAAYYRRLGRIVKEPIPA